ncbi:hypothetical protein LshimejAT787_0409470 [Lyophyllum shimeji]|uniref:Uncharacterized protein n=1 Tax=Lyophyllum shimeji TaxID=47721 RepID=A0A9P3PLI5_LYOSH|nr:hypothetical protein LshimejAT787_0409470 [Lyophyllum shimeji]
MQPCIVHCIRGVRQIQDHCLVGRAGNRKINCPLRDDLLELGTIQRRLAWPLHKDDTLSGVVDLRVSKFILLQHQVAWGSGRNNR